MHILILLFNFTGLWGLKVYRKKLVILLLFVLVVSFGLLSVLTVGGSSTKSEVYISNLVIRGNGAKDSLGEYIRNGDYLNYTVSKTGYSSPPPRVISYYQHQ